MNAFYLRSLNGDPSYNLAVEEYMLDHLPENSLIFLIWQSDNAVIIGRHQNPWKETDSAFMLLKKIMLGRRISGGGAVYHDRGNLNFSFIADMRLLNVDRQLRALSESLVPYGIRATVGERKDLRALGRKFSGSAYAFRHGRALHHGTVLVNADLNMMRALRGRINITRQRGTLSENSAVINLKSINPEISIEWVVGSLRARMEELSGCRFSDREICDMCDESGLSSLHDKHRSWEWRYGNTPAFEAVIGAGGRHISLHVDKGRVGPVIILPEGDALIDAGGAVRFHMGEVQKLLAGANEPRVSLIDKDMF